MQSTSSAVSAPFAEALDAFVNADLFAGARFGIAVRTLDDSALIYGRNEDQLFIGASTTKIPTSAAALAALGSDYRFSTVVRAAGPVDASGSLAGDLVLVPSGDPNLSNRIVNDTIEFRNMDHAMSALPAGAPIERDPLTVIHDLARQIAASGIRRVHGIVRVDLGIFPERDRELGTGVYVSPIVVNDNIIDVTCTAGSRVGEPVSIVSTPPTTYVRFIVEATSARAESLPAIVFDELGIIDGTHTVAIRGTLPIDANVHFPYPVLAPSRFATTVLTEALVAAGVAIEPADPLANVVTHGCDGPIVATHTSPPLGEAIKVVMKVSQNLHAQMLPSIVGAHAAGSPGEGALQAGFDTARELFASWDVDASGARQGDGCGTVGFFTPRYMCALLAAIAQQSFADCFAASLPILGRDGSLHDIQVNAPAAGHGASKNRNARVRRPSQRSGLCDLKGARRFRYNRRRQKACVHRVRQRRNNPIGGRHPRRRRSPRSNRRLHLPPTLTPAVSSRAGRGTATIAPSEPSDATSASADPTSTRAAPPCRPGLIVKTNVAGAPRTVNVRSDVAWSTTSG